MKTKGTKKVLENEELSLEAKFWSLHTLAKKQSLEKSVRTQEEMIYIAQELVIVTPTSDKWYNFYKKYATAYIETNSYGKKLYIRFRGI